MNKQFGPQTPPEDPMIFNRPSQKLPVSAFFDMGLWEAMNPMVDQPQPLADTEVPPVDTKAIQSIHTRSGSTEAAIQRFIDELKALDSDALKVQSALLNLEDALGHFQAARHSLGIYLRDTQDSERVPNGSAE